MGFTKLSIKKKLADKTKKIKKTKINCFFQFII